MDYTRFACKADIKKLIQPPNTFKSISSDPRSYLESRPIDNNTKIIIIIFVWGSRKLTVGIAELLKEVRVTTNCIPMKNGNMSARKRSKKRLVWLF